MFFRAISRQKQTLAAVLRRVLSSSSSSASSPPPPSNLRGYGFEPPPSLSSQDTASADADDDGHSKRRKEKPRYRPPSSLSREGRKPLHSDLPFDFRFSYTESNPDVKPVGLREPKYSPFGPGRVDRVWTGICAPAVDPTVRSVDDDCSGDGGERKKVGRRKSREEILGEPLTQAERKILVEKCQRHRTKRQDKAGGQIIHREGGKIILYRGRYYDPKKRPVIPLMLWKPHQPIYPKLIKMVIDGLTVEETKEMRENGLMVPALTKLAKNGCYANLVTMVRDAFMTDELVRIDCKGLERSDYKKIGVKLMDLVPCTLVTFQKEQIVVWRGKNYNCSAKPNSEYIPSSIGDKSSSNAGENHQSCLSQLFDGASDSDVKQSTQVGVLAQVSFEESEGHIEKNPSGACEQESW